MGGLWSAAPGTHWDGFGIAITDVDTSGNVVEGNIVGLDASIRSRAEGDMRTERSRGQQRRPPEGGLAGQVDSQASRRLLPPSPSVAEQTKRANAEQGDGGGFGDRRDSGFNVHIAVAAIGTRCRGDAAE